MARYCSFRVTEIIGRTARLKCDNCGKEIVSSSSNAISACKKSPARNSQCINLGPETRRVECPTCNGSVELKVFHCAVHGECTISRQINGLKCCKNCEDYNEDTSQNP